MADQEAPGGGGAGVGSLHGGLQETVTQQGAQVSCRKYTVLYSIYAAYGIGLALYCAALQRTVLSYILLQCPTL